MSKALVGEDWTTAAAELRYVVAQMAFLERAEVSEPFSADGMWRVSVLVDSRVWQPRFVAFDDASSYKVEAIRVLEGAMG